MGPRHFGWTYLDRRALKQAEVGVPMAELIRKGWGPASRHFTRGRSGTLAFGSIRSGRHLQE